MREGLDQDHNDTTRNRNDLSGTVHGPSVQAGTIYGNVTFNSAPDRSFPDRSFPDHSSLDRGAPDPSASSSSASEKAVPRQLISAPPNLTGRTGELSALDELFDGQASRLAVLTGPGGVGKTALALAWAHNAQDRFRDGQLYAELGGTEEGTALLPEEALGGFVRALGTPPERVPVSLSELGALYRSLTADRSLLVVLDNAWSAAQVRVLLPTSPASRTVVTSRRRLVGLVPDGARLIEIGPLSTQDSVALLGRTVGARVDREPKPAHELALICGGFPIALCVVASRLAARPRLSLRRLAAELTEESNRLSELSVDDGPAVRAVFDASYRSLEPPTAALYRRLAWHPGTEFGLGPVSAVARTANDHIRGRESDRASSRASSTASLDRLIGANLLQEVGEDRFRFHDLLRLHARRLAEAEDHEQDLAVSGQAILEWYFAAARRADTTLTPYRRRLDYAGGTTPPLLPGFPDRTTALDWLECERVNLVAAIADALHRGLADLAWLIADAMWPLFLYRKHYRDRIRVDRHGVDAARMWGNGWAEAVMLKRLGRVSAVAGGDYVAAERLTRAAIDRYREVGDVRGVLDAEEGLAVLYRESEQYEPARVILTNVLARNRAEGGQRSTGLTLINLGTLLLQLGRPEEAAGLLAEADDIFGELDDIDPYNQIRVDAALADAYLATGNLSQAQARATEAVRRAGELGASYERAEAMTQLGRIAYHQGNSEVAAERYRQALMIFDSLGSSRAAAVRRHLTETNLTPAENPQTEPPRQNSPRQNSPR